MSYVKGCVFFTIKYECVLTPLFQLLCLSMRSSLASFSFADHNHSLRDHPVLGIQLVQSLLHSICSYSCSQDGRSILVDEWGVKARQCTLQFVYCHCCLMLCTGANVYSIHESDDNWLCVTNWLCFRFSIRRCTGRWFRPLTKDDSCSLDSAARP